MLHQLQPQRRDGRTAPVSLLTGLDAFFTDHHHCGELDAAAPSTGWHMTVSPRRSRGDRGYCLHEAIALDG